MGKSGSRVWGSPVAKMRWGGKGPGGVGHGAGGVCPYATEEAGRAAQPTALRSASPTVRDAASACSIASWGAPRTLPGVGGLGSNEGRRGGWAQLCPSPLHREPQYSGSMPRSHTAAEGLSGPPASPAPCLHRLLLPRAPVHTVQGVSSALLTSACPSASLSLSLRSACPARCLLSLQPAGSLTWVQVLSRGWSPVPGPGPSRCVQMPVPSPDPLP